MRGRIVAGVGSVLVAILGAGCDPGSRQVDWSFDFGGNACLQRETRRLRVQIHHDGCFGSTVFFSEDLSAEAPSLTTPKLEPGHYGMEALALDAADVEIGRGCIDVHVPLRGQGVVLTLAPSPPHCDEGPVRRGDAGPIPFPDGGMDCEDDGLPCTSQLSSPDGCLYIAVPGWCAIDGVCYSNGQVNPDDPCHMCDTKTAYTWWVSPPGTPCESGGSCDGLGVCR